MLNAYTVKNLPLIDISLRKKIWKVAIYIKSEAKSNHSRVICDILFWKGISENV